MDFNTIQIEQIIKFFVIGGQVAVLAIMVIYLIFAFVLIRRVKIMNLNLKTPYERVFRFTARAHFIAALVVIVLTLLSIRT